MFITKLAGKWCRVFTESLNSLHAKSYIAVSNGWLLLLLNDGGP